MSGFPGMGHPGDPIGSTLPALEAKTRPAIVKLQPAKYYHCPVPAASMNADDGTRIIFVSGLYMTEVQHIQNYLDREIATNHPNLREATAEEVRAYNMRVNPRATIKAEVAPEIEQELREKLEKEIMEKLASQGIRVNDQFKIEGTSTQERRDAIFQGATESGTGMLLPSTSSPAPSVDPFAPPPVTNEEVDSSLPPPASSPLTGQVASESPTFQSAVVGSDKTPNAQ